MDILKRKRSALKGKSTRLFNVIKAKLESTEFDMCDISVYNGKISELWNELNVLNNEIVIECQTDLETKSNEIEYDEIATKLEDLEIRMAKFKAKEVDANLNISSVNSETASVKLPRIDLPTFNGAFSEWLSFRDLFIATIHNNMTLSKAQKLQYLKLSLKGQAAVLIQSIQITDSNYELAWKLVCDRFENDAEIITSTLDKLFFQPNLNEESASGLRKLLDVTNQCLNTLKILKQPVDKWDTILVYFLRKKLDSETLKHFTLNLERGVLPSFELFSSFIDKRAAALASISLTENRSSRKQNIMKSKEINYTSHYSTANACLFCRESHSLFQCDAFKKASLSVKRQFVRDNKLCFNCLRIGHQSNKCTSSKCKICSKYHHTFLHDSDIRVGNEISNEAASISNHCSESKINASKVILPTAIVKVFDSNGKSHACRAILDSGSEKSFIREACVQMLGLPRHKTYLKLSGLTSSSVGSAKAFVECKIASFCNLKATHLVEALILPKITCDLPQNIVSSSCTQLFNNLKLADEHFFETGPIDILLGADIFPKLLLSGRYTNESGSLSALETIFGWVVLGKINETKHAYRHDMVSTHFTRCNTEFEIEKFWKLEEIPNQQILSLAEKECEEHFLSSYSRNEDGRFIVRLPLKTTEVKLGSSREMAERRLRQNERSFKYRPEKRNSYLDFMHQYESLGHMQLCSESDSPQETFYLPHHAVQKTETNLSKFRVVFDASAKSSNGVSLNDKLMIGPNMQDDIASLLLRFRKHKIAMTADIVKMYRQILVHPDDIRYQKILWRESTEVPIREYNLLTVTYGTNSAPYLAVKCIQQLAVEEGERFPAASKVVKRDFYVDDLMTGANDLNEALQLQKEIIEMLKCGGFELKKWSSNDPRVLERLPPEDCATPLPLEINDGIKALGVNWHPGTDNFTFKLNSVPDLRICTKRTILSNISKTFDPLGWLSPSTIQFKIFMQEIWRLKLDWDERLPVGLQQKWNLLSQDLEYIEQISIQRYISCLPSDTAELLGFSDASERAYAAVVYTRTISEEGDVKFQLIASKTRVAPLKQISLPRLELCGAVLLAKLINFIARALQWNPKISCFTDSTIVLFWLSSHPSRWKTFVAHRVAEVQELLPAGIWNHIDGKMNPADCASRGMSLRQLKDFSLWWHGPPFLSMPNSVRDYSLQYETADALLEERKKTSTLVMSCPAIPNDTTELLNKFSSLSKLKRVTAYCFRFIANCRLSKSDRISGFLTTKELEDALHFWIRLEQGKSFQSEIYSLSHSQSIPKRSKLLPLNPFIDKEGMLRVGGRLRHSKLPENQKFPVLLPKGSFLTELLIFWFHISNLHAGPQLVQSCINQQFWIISSRNVIRKCIRKCLTCVKLQAQVSNQMLGDLPSPRVTPSRPFSKCGVDFSGPFSIRMSRGTRSKTTKSYLCLFVCFATRAIHCELASDLTTNTFIAALKRFIARRGKPSDIYSDCGTNFTGAKKKLDELTKAAVSNCSDEKVIRQMTDIGINWHFNPPAAPHMGGIWEAGIKSVKFHLKRILSNVTLTYEELYTIIVQVEACLNSRPLSPLNNDPADLSVLTPGHFLVGGPLTSVPDTDFLTSKINSLTRWQLTQRLVQHFWKRWSSEYVSRLQQRPRWLSKQGNLQVGDLVLVKNENLPPLKWRLGRIVEVYPGADDCVRVVQVRTADGLFRRPVVKLCRLPLDSQ